MENNSERTLGVLGGFSTDCSVLAEHKDKAVRTFSQLNLDATILTGENCFFVIEKSNAESSKDSSRIDQNSILIGVSFQQEAEKTDIGHYLQIDFSDPNQCVFRSDPVGLVNLYRYIGSNITIFGTSSIFVAAIIPTLKVDINGAYEFLTAGYLFSDRTFYQDISVLPGGTEWVLAPDNFPQGRENRWWQSPAADTFSSTEAIAELVEKTTSVAGLTGSAEHACCDLTGGFDSRGIAAMFLRSGRSFSTIVNGTDDLPDVRIAGNIARIFKLDHHYNDNSYFPLPKTLVDIKRVLYLTDGEIDFTEYYSTSLIQQQTAQKGWMTVNGSGGELFRGYWWEGEWPHEGTRSEVNMEYLLKRILLPGFDFSLFKKGEVEIKAHCSSVILKVLEEVGDNAINGRKIDSLYLRLRLSRWLARYYSSTIKILPCYSPFLFEPILEIAFKVPPKVKRRILFYRKWLSANNQQLAKVPLENGTPAMPCTLITVWRFWRYPGFIAGKIWKKVMSRLGVQKQPDLPVLLHSFLEIALERGDKEFFNSSSMVNVLMSPNGLERLRGLPVEEAVKIMPSGQLTRLVTLELALQEVAGLREQMTNCSAVDGV